MRSYSEKIQIAVKLKGTLISTAIACFEALFLFRV